MKVSINELKLQKKLLENELKKLNQEKKNANVGILGIAYKKNVDDTRESPAWEIIRKSCLGCLGILGRINSHG